MLENIVFYGLEALVILSALAMISIRSPIYSALCLVMVMVGVAGIFVTLNAYFLAAVQLIVYAGAVTVLFVMVVMMIDLKKNGRSFSKGLLGNSLKAFSVGLIWSLIATSVIYVFSDIGRGDLPKISEGTFQMKELAAHLFTKYIFGFEAICILLLLVIVGTVALSRAKGGTHVRND